jgi:hypothetical protein
MLIGVLGRKTYKPGLLCPNNSQTTEILGGDEE